MLNYRLVLILLLLSGDSRVVARDATPLIPSNYLLVDDPELEKATQARLADIYKQALLLGSIGITAVAVDEYARGVTHLGTRCVAKGINLNEEIARLAYGEGISPVVVLWVCLRAITTHIDPQNPRANIEWLRENLLRLALQQIVMLWANNSNGVVQKKMDASLRDLTDYIRAINIDDDDEDDEDDDDADFSEFAKLTEQPVLKRLGVASRRVLGFALAEALIALLFGDCEDKRPPGMLLACKKFIFTMFGQSSVETFAFLYYLVAKTKAAFVLNVGKKQEGK